MYRTLLSVAALLALSCAASAGENPQPAKTVALEAGEAADGFIPLFDGKTLNGWQGDMKGYVVESGNLVCAPGGKLVTDKEYSNFIFRFEFNVPPGGNNGIGIRMPAGGDGAYSGMEIQILDDTHEKYKGWLKDYQHHGSIYGVVPAKDGARKPAGQWNSQEIMADGPHIKVTLNGQVIVDADLSKITETIDHKSHPGLHNEKGYIGFLGHGDRVEFRNIRIKELKK
ncbi:MAG: 3-keto-disaccharide hydrolase [Thermoguttaceae bacterium]